MSLTCETILCLVLQARLSLSHESDLRDYLVPSLAGQTVTSHESDLRDYLVPSLAGQTLTSHESGLRDYLVLRPHETRCIHELD